MRRKAVLEVEYTLASSDSGRPQVPDARKWERVFGGAGLKNLTVTVVEDKAWP